MDNGAINAAYEQGRKLTRSWNKVPSQVTGSGIWFDLSMSPGNPPAQYYFATPLKAAPMARSTDGGIDHGNPMPGYLKCIHQFNIQTVMAGAANLTWEMLDYLAFYPGIDMDVGIKELVTDIAIPRWDAVDGVRIMVVEQNPYVGGARFRITYENNRGETVVSPILVCNAQAVTGTIATTALATNGCTGRFVPLADTEAGVAKILSVEFLTGDVGLLCFVLVKPMMHGQIFETTAPNYYTLPLDSNDLPVVRDDAYLNLICMPTGSVAGANIVGGITTIWSPQT